MDAFMVVPMLAVTKTMAVNPITVECPPVILAKRRIISAKGLVKTPTSSITGINGTGTFSHLGTSGQKISL